VQIKILHLFKPDSRHCFVETDLGSLKFESRKILPPKRCQTSSKPAICFEQSENINSRPALV
jgi:hypothetical protein